MERSEFPEVVSRWQKGELTAVEAMKKLNMASSTFYRKVRRLNHDSVAGRTGKKAPSSGD